MAELEVRGIRLHVQCLGRGDAAPIVFVHGLVMDNLSSWYFTVANRVATRARVILYDLRGHGRSERAPSGYTSDDMVADLAALLDALQVPSVQLVGNSYGGQLALAFAVAHPERVARIALIDAHTAEDGWGERMAGTLALSGDERDRKIADEFGQWLGRHSARKRSRLAQAAQALVYGTSLLPDLRRSPAIADETLRSLRCPVLALYGERSDMIDAGRAMAARLPRCELRVLPGLSHSVLWEATDHVRSALLEWLDFNAEPPRASNALPAAAAQPTRAGSLPTRAPHAGAHVHEASAARRRRYLFVVPPLVGHINPAVCVAEALRARGHACAMVGHSELLRAHAPPGLQIVTIEQDVSDELSAQVQARAHPARGAERLKYLWEEFFIPLAHAMLPSVERAIERYQPDRLIVDQQTLAGVLAARRTGVPWVTLATTPAGVVDPLERLPRVRGWLDGLTTALQLDHGLPAMPNFERSPELMIAFTTRELLGDASVPAQLALVGPALERRRENTAFPWERLNCAPRLLVTLGTINAAAGQRFFHEAARVGHALPVQMIFVAPEGSIPSPPDSAIVAPYVPQIQLLSHVDAVVCHGGHNTVVEALGCGKPLVIAPIKDDQPIVADQVVRTGAGLRVKFGRVRAPELAQAIEAVLHEPSFAQAAARIRASFEAAGGATRAAALIEALP